jgi:dTDP-L-rhamnose 4-epimerase
MSRVLVTGGAGFIGSHLVDALNEQDHFITTIDSLEEQVHGCTDWWEDKPAGTRFFNADCSNHDALKWAHEVGPFDVVFHLAAVVGVGQSQEKRAYYTERNISDTVALTQFWVDNPTLRPGRLIVASSMSIYGEGDRHHGISETACPDIAHTNHYALTKYVQEVECLLFGGTYGVPTAALRFFNVYGERQSLNNPYTGIAAIIASCLLSGRGALIYEDGRQTRDFVSVHDIVQGLLLAMTATEEVIAGEAFNIGTGKATSLLELHALLDYAIGSTGENIAPIITGQKRKGDIRHCFADISKARKLLGYEPRVCLRDGIESYAEWLRTQDVSQVLERVEVAAAELKAKGLLQ